MRRGYSPQYYSPQRRGYDSPQRRGYDSPPRRGFGGGDRGRSPPPPRRGYRGGGGGRGGGRRDSNTGSLLVRNIPMSTRSEELRVPFERFGQVSEDKTNDCKRKLG